MLWIRQVEKSKNNKTENKSSISSYLEYTEHEFASEIYIAGIFNYENSKILCAPFTTEPSKEGLYHYLMRIKNLNEYEFNNNASKNGYHFKGGIFAELLSLFSLYFQCRFYHVADYDGKMTGTSLKIKKEYNFSRKRINSDIDKKPYPEIFDNKIKRNFADEDLLKFLNSIKKLEEKKHQSFIQSCYCYLKALREIGLDEEMFFIRMVSAIEGMAKYEKIKNKSNSSNKELEEFVKKLEPSQCKEQLQGLVEKEIKNQKLTQQFKHFIINNSEGFFKSRKDLEKNDYQITEDSLEEWLTKIYKARSKYLHEGRTMHFGHYLNYEFHSNMDYFPTNSLIDNKEYSFQEQLPYPKWFGKVVRECLVKITTF